MADGKIPDHPPLINPETFWLTHLSGARAHPWAGGLFVNGSQATVTHSTFISNTAEMQGGAIHLYGGYLTLSDSTIYANISNGYGGGIYNTAASLLEMSNVTITGNSAIYFGGAIYNQNSNLVMNNVTISDNHVWQLGGGIFTTNRFPALLNSIVWGNSPTGIHEYSGVVCVSHSVVQGGRAGPGNLDADPRLAPLADYGGAVHTRALLPGSAAIDTGSPVDTGMTGLTADRDSAACTPDDARGVPRADARCDMGAYESRGFTLAYVSGDDQIAPLNRLFGAPPAVTVTANAAGEPVDGGAVTFSVPSGGVSALITPAPIVNGQASASATANALPGVYQVFANPAGGAPAIGFDLANYWMTYFTTIFRQ